MKSLKEIHVLKSLKQRFLHEEMDLLDVGGLDYLRNGIFALSFKVLVFFAIPMFAYFMLRMIAQKNYIAAGVDALFIITYFLLIIVKRIPLEIRNIIMVLSVFLLGFVFIFQFDADASGFIVLLSTIIFIGLMMEKKISIRLILTSILVVLALTIFLFTGRLENQSIALNKGLWVVNILLLYSYGLGIFLLINIMVNGLNKQALQIEEANKKNLASKKRYHAMIANIEDVIVITDGQGIINYISYNIDKMCGWQSKEFLEHSLLDKIQAEDRAKALAVFNEMLSEEQSKETIELRHCCKNGEYKTLKVTISNLLNDPIIEGVLINYHDITDRRHYEKKIIHMSHHDELTGLYNRAYFNMMKIEMDREEYLPLSLISADIDGLKIINDSLGHQEGDRIIELAAELFKKAFRKEDIIARVGGDEFVIVLPKTSAETTYELVERSHSKCAQYNLQNVNKAHYLSISMGVATKTSVHENVDEILKKADYQMYNEKNTKKKDLSNQVIFSMMKVLFNKLPELEEESKRWALIAREIGEAISLSEEELKNLELLAIFADGGKVGIEEKMLKKEDRLSDQERGAYQRHPEIGYRIAKAIPELSAIADCILAHQENWDGSGYPKGLAGEMIPLLSRIRAIAKFYDQLEWIDNTQMRCESDRIAELKKAAGIKLDPALTQILINRLTDKEKSFKKIN